MTVSHGQYHEFPNEVKQHSEMRLSPIQDDLGRLRLWRDQTAQRFPYGLRHSSAYDGFGAEGAEIVELCIETLIGARVPW